MSQRKKKQEQRQLVAELIRFLQTGKRQSIVIEDYFKEWNGNGPIFTSNVNKSKKYWTEKQAEEDITILYKATSPIARTLSIKLVP